MNTEELKKECQKLADKLPKLKDEKIHFFASGNSEKESLENLLKLLNAQKT